MGGVPHRDRRDLVRPEQLAALDAVSTPALNFPADNNRDLAPLLQFAGATVDGQVHGPSPLLASSDARY